MWKSGNGMATRAPSELINLLCTFMGCLLLFSLSAEIVSFHEGSKSGWEVFNQPIIWWNFTPQLSFSVLWWCRCRPLCCSWHITFLAQVEKLLDVEFLLKCLHSCCSRNTRKGGKKGENRKANKQTLSGGYQHKNGKIQEQVVENKDKERPFWIRTRLSRWRCWDQRRYIVSFPRSDFIDNFHFRGGSNIDPSTFSRSTRPDQTRPDQFPTLLYTKNSHLITLKWLKKLKIFF